MKQTRRPCYRNENYYKDNTLRPWTGWKRYNRSGIMLNGYVDIGKCHFPERSSFSRGSFTRKKLIMCHIGNRYLYPSTKRKYSKWFSGGIERWITL